MGAIRYLANVTKSMAYTTIDVVKDMNPAFTSFAETNQEVGQIAYRTIRDFKQSVRTGVKMIDEHEYTGYVKKGFKNAWADLKSGNWYNKERMQQAEDMAIDSILDDGAIFEVQDDENDGFGDWDDDSESSYNSDEFLSESMDEVGERSATAVSTAILKSAELQTQARAEMHKQSSIASRVMYSGVRSDLGTINLNLANLVKFNTDVMQTHVKNSTDFYTNQTSLMTETRDILKEMLEMQKSANGVTTRDSGSSDTMKVRDIMDSEGMLDIASLGKFLKQKANDSTGGALDMLKSYKEMGMLDTIAAAPLQFLTKGIATKMVAPAVKKSFEELNKAMSGVMSTAILRMSDWKNDDNLIKRFLGNTFGLDESVRSGYSLSGYNKNATAWTGKDHKALTEVIPTLLSSINANLGGANKRYDYEKGRFIDIKNTKKEYDNMVKNAAMTSAMDIYYDYLNPEISKMTWSSKAEENVFREQLNKVLETNFKNSTLFDPKGKNKASDFGINIGTEAENEAVMKRIEELWSKIPEFAQLSYSNGLMYAMDSFNDQMKRLEESGDSIYNQLFNGSADLVSSTPNAVQTAVAAAAGKNQYRAAKKKGRNAKKDAQKNNTNTQSTSQINTDWDQVVLNKAKEEHPEYFTPEGELKDDYVLKDGKIEKESILNKIGVKNPLDGKGFDKKIDYVEKPVSDFVNLITKGIYKVFFPDHSESTEEEGMSFPQKIAFGISNYMKESQDKLHDYFDEYLGNMRDFFKEKLEKLKESELISNFRNGFKEGFKGIKDFVKGSFKETGDWLGVTEDTSDIDEVADLINAGSNAAGGRVRINGIPLWYSAASGHARGNTLKKYNKKRKNANQDTVKKTGLALVSEGETITNDDHNDPDKLNNRIKKEKSYINRILSGEKCDDLVYGSVWDSLIQSDDIGKLKTLIKKNSDFLAWIQSDPEKRKTIEEIKKKKSKNIVFGKNMYAEAKNALHASKDIATDLMSEAKTAIVGEKDKEQFNAKVDTVMDEIKQQFPNFVTGAAIGGGVSLLTGAIGGPLLGAAAGSAIGLLVGSERVRSLVFGEEVVKEDEKGNKYTERQGGLLPKDVSSLITKYAPNMAKGATVGAITSILPFVPGGPVAGIILGSAVGFATKNEAAQEMIFGLMGDDMDKEKFQKKVQKVLPKMGLGALGGLVVGPFGPAANVILGASLGFASDTDAFKNAIFGEEVVKTDENGEKYVTREGGIYGAIKETIQPATNFIKEQITSSKKWLKDKVLSPIERLISPLGVQIKQMFKSIGGVITGLAKGVFQKFMDHMSGTLFGKVVGGLAKGALKIARLPLSAVGGVATVTGNALRRHQLRVGTAHQVKGLETAEARIQERDSIGRGIKGHFDKRYSSLDEALNKMDPQEIEQLLEAQKAINEGDKYIKNTRTSERNKINMALKKGSLKNVPKRVKVKIRDLAAEGKYTEALNIVQTLNIDDEAKDKLLKVIETSSKKINKLNDPNKLLSDSSEVLNTFLRSQGISGKINSKNLQAILESEVKANKGAEEEQKEEEQKQIPENIRDNTTKIVNILTEIKDILRLEDFGDEDNKNESPNKRKKKGKGKKSKKKKQQHIQATEQDASNTPEDIEEEARDAADSKEEIKELLEDNKTELGDKINNNSAVPKRKPGKLGSVIGYIATAGGKLLQTKTDAKGNTIVNHNDDATSDALQEMEEEKEQSNSLLTSMKNSMFGLFDRFKKKDEEEEESKKSGKGGLLGTLWEFFAGSSTTTKMVTGGAVALLATGIADKLGLTDKLEEAGNWIIETGLPKFMDFLVEKVVPRIGELTGGLATLITNGAEVVFGKMLPALIPAVITSLPDIAGSIIRGLAKLPSAIADAINGKKDGQNYYDVATVSNGSSTDALSAFGGAPSSINRTVGEGPTAVSMNYTVGSQWSNSNLSLSSSNYTVDGSTETSSTTTTPPEVSSLSNAVSATASNIASSSNSAVSGAISNMNRDRSLPKAFQAGNSNDAVYKKVTASYDSIANNIVSVNGTQMTIDDLLNSDEIVGYVANSETGEQIAVHGYEVLKYPSLAKQFGIDTYLSDEEMSEQQKRMGIESSEEKLAKRAALTSVEAVLNPRQARRISNVLGKVGDGLNGFGNMLTRSRGARFIQKLPGGSLVTKPLGYTSKLFGGAANAGSTYMDALGSVQDRLAGVSRDFSDVLPDEIGLFDDVVEEGAETATQSRGGLRGFIDKFRKTDVVDTGLEFADEVSDSSLADKVFNSRIGNKVDDITGGALTRANDFIVDNRVKISNGINDIKGAVSTKVDDVTGALSTKVDDIAGSMSSKLASSADSNILVKWAGKAQAGIVEFFSNSKIVKKFSDAASELGEKFSKEALQEAAEKIAKKLAEFLIEHGMKKLGAAIAKINIAAATAMISQIATAIYGFFSGYNNANTIMGVTEMPNVGVRCICGVIQALNEAFCFGIIPLDIVFDCIWGLLKLVFPSLENCDLEKERQAAQEELAKYNLEHGTDLSLDEYNDRDKIGTQIKNAIFGIEKVNEDGTTYKEGGLVNSIKDGASNLINSINQSETWGNITLAGNNIRDAIISRTTGGAFNDDEVRAKLGLDDNVDVTLTDRASVFLGNISNNMFGVDASQQVNSLLTAAKNMPGAINDRLGAVFGFTDEDGNPIPLTEGVIDAVSNIRDTVVSRATGGAFNDDEVRAKLGLDDNVKVSLTDRASVFLGNISNNMFGVDATGQLNSLFTAAKNMPGAINDRLGAVFGFTDKDGNPVSLTEGVVGTANDIKNGVISGVKNAWSSITTSAKEFATNVYDTATSVYSGIKSGLSNAANKLNDTVGSFFGFTDAEGNPVSFTEGVGNAVSSAKDTIAGAIRGAVSGATSVYNTVSSAYDGIKNGLSTAADNLNKTVGGFFGFTDEEGNPVSFTDGVGSALSDAKDTITGAIKGAITGATNVWNTIGDNLGDFGEKLKNGLSTAADNLNKTVGGFFGFTDEEGNPIAFTDAVKDKFDGAKNTVANFWSSLAEYGAQDVARRNAEADAAEAGKGSGIAGTFISQRDPRNASKAFSNDGDTIGEAGCAPASAAMALNLYGRGSVGLDQTARHATKYKLKNDGVTPDYFADEFARNGLQSNYIDGSRSDLIGSAISSRNPVVLLGADASNRSKRNSPFGPNNHYVVANGTSRDGSMIYINDPEASHGNIAYPTSKILNHTKLAVTPYSAGKGSELMKSMRRSLRRFAGRGTTYGEGTPQYIVWTRMIGAGYSEYAVAGAMGNIHCESGYDPSVIEKGSGAGFGLCQWTGGRRDQLNAFAAARGADPADINLQVDFLLAEIDKNHSDPNVSYQMSGTRTNNSGTWSYDTWANATDLSTATHSFCWVFERPNYEKSHIDNRIAAAQTYYEEFTGTPGVVGNVEYAKAGTISGDSSSTGTTGSSSSSGGTFISKLLSGIDTIAGMFGLTDNSSSTDGTISTSASSSTDMGSSSSSGVSVNGSDIASAASSVNGNVSRNYEDAIKQRQLVAAMKRVEGKLNYSQEKGKRDPENGSGDCSSTVQWAYKKVLGVDPGSNTREQRVDDDTYTVATNVDDESKLQLGDLLLRDGHVEMYSGPGQMIGHGGPNWPDLGPTTKTLGKHPSGKPYNLVRRWVGFQNPGKSYSATGIGNNTISAMGSGIAGRATDIYSTDNQLVNPLTSTSASTYRTNDSALTTTKNSTTNINVTAPSSNDDTLKALIQAVLQIVQNTSHVQEIVSLLAKIVSLTGGATPSASNDSTNQAILNNSREIATTKSALAKLLSDSAKQSNSTDLQSLINAVEGLAVQ